jgi:hypothetical protein
MDSRSTLKRDFGIFAEPGFLVALIIVFALVGLAAFLLVSAAERYGIPVSPYWS